MSDSGRDWSGVRVPWERAPQAVRSRVEELLGSTVVSAVTAPNGFSPAVAAALTLANGEKAFVKAVSSGVNEDSADIYRAEARVAAALPRETPAPRLLTWFEIDGWVVLVFEYVDGEVPRSPWDAQELRRVLSAVDDLSRILTPSPIAAPTVAGRWGERFRGWRRFAAAGGHHDLDPWLADHLDELAALESAWEEATVGDTLLHCDLRADNVLLTADGVVVVDWPWASVGAAWFDLIAMLPSVALQGGPPPGEVVASHPITADVDPEAITSAVTALTGFFIWHSVQPPTPGLPTVRAFQAAQGRTAGAWLRERLARHG